MYPLVLLFVLVTVVRGEFDEAKAVRLFHLAAASYGDRVDECLARAHEHPSDNWEVHVNSVQECDIFDNSCAFFISHSKRSGESVISFRGTKTPTQLFVEGWQSLTPSVDFFDMGLVNRYFITAHLSMWKAIEEYLSLPEYKHHKVYFTGHSLGGALASLAAARTVKQGYRPSSHVQLYTFGQPRPGSLKFARSFDALVPESYRIVNGRDVVPHLPSCAKNESATRNNVAPCSTRMEDEAYHHGTEVWYPAGMVPGSRSFVVCRGEPRNEDFSCSDKLKYRLDDFGQAVNEHRTYYGIKVSKHGKSACVHDVYRGSRSGEEEGAIGRALTRVNSFFKAIGFTK